jgi:hypothetical protein
MENILTPCEDDCKAQPTPKNVNLELSFSYLLLLQMNAISFNVSASVTHLQDYATHADKSTVRLLAEIP